METSHYQALKLLVGEYVPIDRDYLHILVGLLLVVVAVSVNRYRTRSSTFLLTFMVACAIGAAMETLRVVKRRGHTTFVGLEQAIDIKYVTKNDEETRCHFCPNKCSRTFIDTKTPDGTSARYIAGFSCEKGTVEDK